MEQVNCGINGCDVAAYVSGASFTFVMQAVGTAIAPGIGSIIGWGLGSLASLYIADDCK